MKSESLDEFRTITYPIIYEMYQSMRQIDVDEGVNLYGGDLLVKLITTVNASSFCKAIYVKNQLVCFIGVTPDTVGANPWMLGTDLLDQYPIRIVKYSRAYVTQWLEFYKYLHNVVDARNTTTIKWLEFTGFTIHEPTLMGIQKLPYHKFTMGNPIMNTGELPCSY